MRDTFYLVPASQADLPYTRHLAAELQQRRAAVVISGDIPIGSSVIAQADEQIARARVLAFITGAGRSQDAIAAWQVLQFRCAIALGADAVLLIVPQSPFLFPAQTHAKTILLTTGLSAEHAARHCIAAAKFSADDDLTLPPPDRVAAGALSDGAWSTVRELGARYEKEAQVIMDLLDLGYRDEASNIYWNIFHYSGFRERWTTRLALSRALLQATKAAKHNREAGLILSKGIAYVHMHTNRSLVAMHALRAAYGYSIRANDKRGIGICWSYAGDLAIMAGNFDEAIDDNSEAYKLMKGVDQHEVQLKNELLNAMKPDVAARDRVKRLTSLRSDFAEVENYRELSVSLHDNAQQ